jgi:hypothetical protein
MPHAIRADKIETLSGVDDGEQTDVYNLKVGEIDLGYLYLTGHNYTLTWDADFEFRHLQDFALAFLYRQLDVVKGFLNFRVIRHSTKVSLVSSNKLYRFAFSQTKCPDEYEALLSNPNSISFARYDFELESLPAIYSFTAENPYATPQGNREMAILLPRSQPLAKGLLNWIVINHIHYRELKHSFDLYSSYHKLATLIASRKV